MVSLLQERGSAVLAMKAHYSLPGKRPLREQLIKNPERCQRVGIAYNNYRAGRHSVFVHQHIVEQHVIKVEQAHHRQLAHLNPLQLGEGVGEQEREVGVEVRSILRARERIPVTTLLDLVEARYLRAHFLKGLPGSSTFGL